jgi:glycosyltransferase involved in cell wall biosynthesis
LLWAISGQEGIYLRDYQLCCYAKKSVVIPCYNEEKRLDISQFHEALGGAYFLFVNDGSIDETLSFLEANQMEGMCILNLDRNCGKGEAVRRGMQHVKSLPIYDKCEWFGFLDADLSTPIFEIHNFLRYNEAFGYNADAIWGSRVKRLGGTIHRLPSRHLFGRAFATLTGFLLKTNFYDSQCGAKIFKKEIIDELFREPFISDDFDRTIYAVEVLLHNRISSKRMAGRSGDR